MDVRVKHRLYTLDFKLVSVIFHIRYREGRTYVRMGGRTYGRTILSKPKFLGCVDNQISLPMVLRYTRVQDPHYEKFYSNFFTL